MKVVYLKNVLTMQHAVCFALNTVSACLILPTPIPKTMPTSLVTDMSVPHFRQLRNRRYCSKITVESFRWRKVQRFCWQVLTLTQCVALTAVGAIHGRVIWLTVSPQNTTLSTRHWSISLAKRISSLNRVSLIQPKVPITRKTSRRLKKLWQRHLV